MAEDLCVNAPRLLWSFRELLREFSEAVLMASSWGTAEDLVGPDSSAAAEAASVGARGIAMKDSLFGLRSALGVVAL